MFHQGTVLTPYHFLVEGSRIRCVSHRLYSGERPVQQQILGMGPYSKLRSNVSVLKLPAIPFPDGCRLSGGPVLLLMNKAG